MPPQPTPQSRRSVPRPVRALEGQATGQACGTRPQSSARREAVHLRQKTPQPRATRVRSAPFCPLRAPLPRAVRASAPGCPSSSSSAAAATPSHPPPPSCALTAPPQWPLRTEGGLATRQHTDGPGQRRPVLTPQHRPCARPRLRRHPLPPPWASAHRAVHRGHRISPRGASALETERCLRQGERGGTGSEGVTKGGREGGRDAGREPGWLGNTAPPCTRPGAAQAPSCPGGAAG